MLKIEPLVMKNVKPNESIRNLLKANRYQCNTVFYVSFLQELGLLQLWDQQQEINRIYQEVLEIEKLIIKQNQNFDNNLSEGTVKELTQKINTALIKLNTEKVKPIMEICNKMNEESLSRKVLIRLQKSINSSKYEEIIRRIWTNIHNLNHRTDAILLIGILDLVNGQNIVKLGLSYHNAIERSITELKNFKGFVKQLQKNIQAEILSTIKFGVFVHGIIKMYALTNRLYEVLKLLEGQNNYKFKLNTLKTQINNVIKYLNSRLQVYGLPGKYELIEDDINNSIEKVSGKWFITSYKQYLIFENENSSKRVKQGLCAFCLSEGQLVTNGQKRVHLDCWNWLRKMST